MNDHQTKILISWLIFNFLKIPLNPNFFHSVVYCFPPVLMTAYISDSFPEENKILQKLSFNHYLYFMSSNLSIPTENVFIFPRATPHPIPHILQRPSFLPPFLSIGSLKTRLSDHKPPVHCATDDLFIDLNRFYAIYEVG